jgi:hypothetical protein
MLFYPYRKLFSSALHFAVPEEQTEHHAQTRETTEKAKLFTRLSARSGGGM